MTVPILRVEALRTALATQEGVVQVLDGVDIEVAPGEIVGLVGESGCGKSMTALSVMGLILPALGRVTGGRVMFDGTDLLQLAPRDMRAVRGRRLAMVFQDPTTFLNPVLTVGTQIDEMLRQANPGEAATGTITFEHIIQSFYVSAMIAMGAGTEPGQKPRIDILGARQSIDMLALLQDKTKGNLTSKESATLQNVLFELRMMFLEITNAIAAQAQRPPDGRK